MKQLIALTILLACSYLSAAEHWSSDTYVIWPQKPNAPKQTAVVSFSDWLVFGDATFGKPGVRFIINKMAAAGIRTVWWRTFGGGLAQYSSKVHQATLANYAGQGADYSTYDSLNDAVDYAHKLGLTIKAWYTPLEEAHGWPDNVRSRYTDLHKDLWDRNFVGLATGAPSFYYPEYRAYKLAFAREVLCDYDTDGIVIDFERGGAPTRNDTWGYIPEVVQAYNQQYGTTGIPQPNNPQWQAFRADFVGQFMRGIREIVKNQRQKPADITAIFPARKALSAHYDIPRWCREGIIDRLGLIAHGSRWGSPSPNLATLTKEYSKHNKPSSAILYSLKGSRGEVQSCFDKAVQDGADAIVWFETTYLYFNNYYDIPLKAACPVQAIFISPEYDLSAGGELVVTAAGPWTLTIDNKHIAAGKADTTYKLTIPKQQQRQPLTFFCSLPKQASKAGIAVQGTIGLTAVHSDRSWTSPQGNILTLAQPGIPPFLAPFDTAVQGGAK